MTKFCKDCKFCVYERGLFGTKDYHFAKCSARDEEMKKADEAEFLVTGTYPPPSRSYCSTARSYDPCGPEGKLWEAISK